MFHDSEFWERNQFGGKSGILFCPVVARYGYEILKRSCQVGSWIYESMPKEEVWVEDTSLGVINSHMKFKTPLSIWDLPEGEEEKVMKDWALCLAHIWGWKRRKNPERKMGMHSQSTRRKRKMMRCPEAKGRRARILKTSSHLDAATCFYFGHHLISWNFLFFVCEVYLVYHTGLRWSILRTSLINIL